jgi:hypothetical protein
LQREFRQARSALDLHEEITDPQRGRGGCTRWPEALRLLSSEGEYVRGRCGSTNQCAYCAKLGAVENTEMLALDALEYGAPETLIVLTTATTIADPAHYYEALWAVARAVRRRWPGFEYSMLLEFTTGYGERSGGERRPHFNLVVKGVQWRAVYNPPRCCKRAGCEADTPCGLCRKRLAGDLGKRETLRDVVRRVWCGREELRATPGNQYVRDIRDAGGLFPYLALHFQKESQAPPEGWRGHRFRSSRGYFGAGSAKAAREQARESLRGKRAIHRLQRDAGWYMTAAEIDWQATLYRELRRDVTWRVVQARAPATGKPYASSPPPREVSYTDGLIVGVDGKPRFSAAIEADAGAVRGDSGAGKLISRNRSIRAGG